MDSNTYTFLKMALSYAGFSDATVHFPDGTTARFSATDESSFTESIPNLSTQAAFHSIVEFGDRYDLDLRGTYSLTDRQLIASPFFISIKSLAKTLCRHRPSIEGFINEYVPIFVSGHEKFVDLRLYISARAHYIKRHRLDLTPKTDGLLDLTGKIQGNDVAASLDPYVVNFVPYSTDPYLRTVADLVRLLSECTITVRRMIQFYDIPKESNYSNPAMYDIRKVIEAIKTKELDPESKRLLYVRKKRRHLEILEAFLAKLEESQKK